jgi:hypothetical protein
MPNAIAADTSVANPLRRRANGQYTGLAHTFIGSSWDPRPWSGFKSLKLKKLANRYAVRIVAWAILPSAPL